ncbi:hypothetical protein [Actinomadura sp. 9N407]|uniref:hypothetical protein n=1 Tax=Actinomadura sp. 9N407 TaxID=3375154 RepID=UPI0037B2517F
MPYEGAGPGPGADTAGDAAGTGTGAGTVTGAARRLLGGLRELARARHEPGRDVGAHDPVHWLADLPGEVYVETDAGPGDVIFSIPVIPLSPPAVLEEFDGWLGMRHWYRALRDTAERAAAQGTQVVLATGLLAWRPPEGPAIRDHLLSTPVRIAVDERSGRLDVILDGRSSARDRELLAGLSRFWHDRTEWVWDTIQATQGYGLQASVADVLRKWCTVAFGDRSEAVTFREDWVPVPAGQMPSIPQLRLAPALVVRPPGQAAVAEHFDRLIARLDEGPVPAGLATFLAPRGRSPVLHVEDRGPATIADMIAGLLAQGRRVLVASPDGPAAGELHATLPAGIAGLCAAVTGAGAASTGGPVNAGGPASTGGPAASDSVAAAILERAAVHDPSQHRERLAELTRQETAARTAVTELRQRLEHSEGAETHDLGSRYQGTRVALDERLRAEAAGLAWMPARPGMAEKAPITRPQAADLVRLLAEETTERRARVAQRDVDPATLPSPPYVRTLIEAEAAAIARAERSETDLSRRLRQCDVHLLARLDGCASAVNAALHELGLEGHPGGWDSTDHAVLAFTDALARRRPAVWERVAEMTSQAQWAERALRSQAGHRVRMPPGDPDLRQLADAVRQLRHYLDDGGSWKRGPLRSATQRQTEPLLHGITVDDRPPTDSGLLGILFTHLMVRIACRELQYVWEAAGVSFPADVPLEDRVSRFVRAHARLVRLRDVLPAIEETVELLTRAELGIPLTHPIQWHGYVTGLGNAIHALGVNRAAADLAALRDSIGKRGDGDGEDPPELRAALAAIDARDDGAYGRCLRGLAEARHERVLQNRCEELLDRVHAAHPDLAELLATTAGDPDWHVRAERWDEAWAWARATALLAEISPSTAETGLRDELDEATERLDEASARLASAQAWGTALARIVPSVTAPAEVVPAWIVPLWRVPDVLPPRPDAFDVVIVDGDSGAGAEALFVLWPAPRVILVGPRGPDLPVPDGPVPADLAEYADPTATLFGALLNRFDPAALPQRAVAQAEAPVATPLPVALPRPGRSIVTYKRSELVELVRRAADGESGRTDDQLVELVSALLDCPADEQLLVGARIRYAVEVFRGTE